METEAPVKMEELSILQKSHSHTESVTPAKGGYPKGRTKKPKRNKSAFILFSIGMRAKLKTNEADQLNSNEMMVKLAELWKNLPKAEREAYYTEARDDKLRYLRELDNFSKNHPSESIHNRTKKNHIKKPCSAYAIFLREKKGVIKEGKPDLKMADILKIVSEQWKNLTEEERIIYKDKAQEEKETVRIKLGESMDKAKKANLINQKKVKTQEHSSDHAVEVRESSKVPFKIGSTGDLRLKLDNTDLSSRAFDRTFSTMSTLNTMSRGREFSLWEGAAPSLSSLLSFPVTGANNDSSAKDDSELDEGGRSLLKLFDKAVQKASELLVDLFNFNLPTERFDTLNFGQRSSIQPDFNLMIPQLLNPLENLSFPSPSILKPVSRNEAANESASKVVKTLSQGNAEQRESSSPEVQVVDSTSPPKET